jgi:alginate O-acetyltransferase complex protein AlgI
MGIHGGIGMPADVPAWTGMWLLALAIYTTSKLTIWLRCGAHSWSAARQLVFVFAWPGMDVNPFSQPRAVDSTSAQVNSGKLSGTCCVVFGALLFWRPGELYGTDKEFIITWCGMIGVVLMLHFGLFRFLAAFWRGRGYDVRPIMNAPLAARSVSEFWGRRWNSGFRDLTAQTVFRPLARRWGVPCATWISFLFSGIVHDVVISLPAGAGYGQPTLYFLLQALAVQFEHSRLAERYLLRRPIVRRAFAFMAIVAPVNLLFHAPFRQDVVIPFMEACGAR